MPLPWKLVGDGERRLGRLRIAEADVVPDADDALVGRIAHDADQGAALGPVGLDEAPDEPVACDGEAVEAEEAATDGEVGEERHHAAHVLLGRRSQPQRGAVAQDDVDGRLRWLGEIDHVPSVTDRRSPPHPGAARTASRKTRSGSRGQSGGRTTEYRAQAKSTLRPSVLQLQLDPAGQERGAGTERDRRDRHDHLVQQPRVGELPHQVSAADDPDVPAAGSCDELLVHRHDVPAHELDRGVGHDRQLPVGKDPARDVVRPLPVRDVLVRELVVEKPFVRRRAHRDRTHVGDERAVVHCPVLVLFPA